MADVRPGLRARERLEVIARCNALGQLTELGLIQDRRQLRLTDENYLEELLPGRLEVREETHLLEHLGGEVLRLVDDDHGATARGVRLQEMRVETVHQRFRTGRAGGIRDA